MVIKIYGALTASTERVLAILHEKNAPYELILVNLATGEHKSPAFLEKQPFGNTPYLDDDGFILYESRAITYYIAAKYMDQGTPLIPTETKERALLQQAVFTEICQISELTMAAMFAKIYKPLYFGLPVDEATYRDAIDRLSANLGVLDRILSKQRFLTGDSISLADLYHLPNLKSIEELGGGPLEGKENVKRWAAEITSRPSWKAVLAIESKH